MSLRSFPNRLKASLNIDSRYASLEPGILPASLDKRHNIPTKRSDFLADGTPVTPQGAKQAFGRAETVADDTTGDICFWRSGDSTSDSFSVEAPLLNGCKTRVPRSLSVGHFP